MKVWLVSIVVVLATGVAAIAAACGGGENVRTAATEMPPSTVLADTPTIAASSAASGYEDAVTDWLGIYLSARKSWLKASQDAPSATDRALWRGQLVAAVYALRDAASKFSPPQPAPHLREGDMQLRHGIDLVARGADLLIEAAASSNADQFSTGTALIEDGHREVMLGVYMVVLPKTRAECEKEVQELLGGPP